MITHVSRFTIVSGLIAIAVFTVGCTSQSLARNTTDVSESMRLVYYQQILDNVARMKARPNALPSFSIIESGQVQISDKGSISLTIGDFFGPPTADGTPSASRTITQQWKILPVHDASDLERIGIILRNAASHGGPDADGVMEGEINIDIKSLFIAEDTIPDSASDIPVRPWYTTIRPRGDVWLQATCDDVTIYVRKENEGELANLTRLILAATPATRDNAIPSSGGILLTP